MLQLPVPRQSKQSEDTDTMYNAYKLTRLTRDS